MKDKKYLVLFGFAIILGCILWYVTRPIEGRKSRLASGHIKQDETLDTKKLDQARESINSFVQISTNLEKKLNIKERQLREEKKRTQNLETKLKELVTTNEKLQEDLALTKASLNGLENFVQPIKTRFIEVEGILNNIDLGPGQEKTIRK